MGQQGSIWKSVHRTISWEQILVTQDVLIWPCIFVVDFINSLLPGLMKNASIINNLLQLESPRIFINTDIMCTCYYILLMYIYFFEHKVNIINIKWKHSFKNAHVLMTLQFFWTSIIKLSKVKFLDNNQNQPKYSKPNELWNVPI